MPELIHDFSRIDFDRPGKHHYQLAFHMDSSWGYSLVPLRSSAERATPTPTTS